LIKCAFVGKERIYTYRNARKNNNYGKRKFDLTTIWKMQTDVRKLKGKKILRTQTARRKYEMSSTRENQTDTNRDGLATIWKTQTEKKRKFNRKQYRTVKLRITLQKIMTTPKNI
jgi:hypothetical protein